MRARSPPRPRPAVSPPARHAPALARVGDGERAWWALGARTRRYNKPEGLNAWLAREGLSPTALAFVDDNSDNAFSMFAHFAAREREHAATHGAATAAVEGGSAAPPPVCCAVWYPPETSATQESFDPPTREMLLALSRGPL